MINFLMKIALLSLNIDYGYTLDPLFTFAQTKILDSHSRKNPNTLYFRAYNNKKEMNTLVMGYKMELADV